MGTAGTSNDDTGLFRRVSLRVISSSSIVQREL